MTSHPLLPMGTVERWFDALGSPRIADALLRGIDPVVPLAHLFLFLQPHGAPVEVLCGASRYGGAALRAAQQYLAMGFERYDVNTRRLRTRRARARPLGELTLQTIDDITDARYRHLCYEVPGVHSRASILVTTRAHGPVAINLYRTLSLPRFSPAELRQLRGWSTLLGALVDRHLALARPHAAHRREQSVLATLSAREREVIQGILAGQTAKMQAQRLDLSVNTVLTYRYRAFARLGIRREKELFGLLRE